MRRALLPSLALALLTVVLAGCVGGNGGGDEDDDGTPVVVPADWAERALANEKNDDGTDHDHRDAAHHLNRTTPNFQVLGWDPLITKHHGRTSGSYVCGDVSQGDRRIGVVHSHMTTVAFVVVDVTDDRAPKMIGELVMPNTFIYDLTITPDARYVVLATSDLSSQNEDGPLPPTLARDKLDPFNGRPYFRDGCGLRPVPSLVPLPADVPYAGGVVLVDMATPEEPQIVDFEPAPILGAHSVFATSIDETYYVLGAVTNLVHTASEFFFYTIDETPLGPQLVTQSVYRPAPPVSDQQPRINGHTDGWIQRHPGTGQVLAYLADWDGGLVILDLTNINVPVETGRWSNYYDQGPTTIYGDNSGSIHSAIPMTEMWGDRHITIIGQEVLGRPADTPTGVIYLLDTTDPANPTPVSGWTLPVDPVWDEDLLYSTHYITVVDRTMFVTMYHGGVWAVDIATVETPRSVGVFLPTNVSPAPAGDELYPVYNWAPTVLEAHHLVENTLLVWDGGSGAYTVAFDPTFPMPAVEEWPVEI